MSCDGTDGRQSVDPATVAVLTAAAYADRTAVLLLLEPLPAAERARLVRRLARFAVDVAGDALPTAAARAAAGGALQPAEVCRGWRLRALALARACQAGDAAAVALLSRRFAGGPLTDAVAFAQATAELALAAAAGAAGLPFVAGDPGGVLARMLGAWGLSAARLATR